MTPERLAEIRDRVTYNPEDWPITIELVAHIDTLTAEIATLKGEVRRLTQCETNMTFLLDCIEKAQFNLPDYTLGTWQERAKGLAPAIATLRTRLDALVTAASDINDFLSDEALMDLICDIRHMLPNMESEERFDKSIVESIARWSKRDALSAAVREAKGDG